MKKFLSSEWLKMRKRWMPRVLILILMALTVLIFWATSTNANERANVLMPRAWLTAIIFCVILAPFLWPILAGSVAGGEYGWGTIRMVLSRNPGRTQFALAGLVCVLAVVAIALLSAAIVGSAAAAVISAATGNALVYTDGLTASFWSTLAESLLAVWYCLAFYVVLAYAAGTIFRSSAVGIGVGIGIIIAEIILRGVFFGLGGTWRTVAEHFPSAYTNALPARVASGSLTKGFISLGSTAPDIGASIVAIAVYTAIPLVITLLLVRRRDVTA